MNATEGAGEGRMVGIRDWPYVNALSSERRIRVAGEGNDLVLACIEYRGEDDRTQAAGSASDCDFDHALRGRVEVTSHTVLKAIPAHIYLSSNQG